MIEIKATGDTTLKTKGKYCEDDILVKVPAPNSGGGVGVSASSKFRIPTYEGTSVSIGANVSANCTLSFE